MGFCGTKTNALSVSGGVLKNECFVDVLNIVPHAIVLLVSIFILIVWSKSSLGQIRVTAWVHFAGHNIRWILTLLLILICIIEIWEGVISDSLDPDSVNLHVFLPACFAFCGAIISIVFYHNIEQWNSPRFLLLLMGYWISMVILKTLKGISLYKNKAETQHMRVWLTWISVVLYSFILLVELNVLRIQVSELSFNIES